MIGAHVTAALCHHLCVKSRKRSDLSGAVLDGDAPATLTVVLPDGSRRRLTVTAAEAESLRGKGLSPGLLTRLMHLPWLKIATWVVVTVVAALVGQAIADRSTGARAEAEIDAGIVEDLSRASVALLLDAQTARRAETAAKRSELGNQATHAWVLESGALKGRLEAYYQDSRALDEWYDYQKALYNWGGLSIDRLARETPAEASARRVEDVEEIRAYAEPCSRPVPDGTDPWTAMAAEPPVDEVAYQWVGYCLLGHRSDVTREVIEARPDLGDWARVTWPGRP